MTYFNEEGTCKKVFGSVMSVIALTVGSFLIYEHSFRDYRNDCQKLMSGSTIVDVRSFCADDCKSSNLVMMVGSGKDLSDAFYETKTRCHDTMRWFNDE